MIPHIQVRMPDGIRIRKKEREKSEAGEEARGEKKSSEKKEKKRDKLKSESKNSYAKEDASEYVFVLPTLFMGEGDLILKKNCDNFVLLKTFFT